VALSLIIFFVYNCVCHSPFFFLFFSFQFVMKYRCTPLQLYPFLYVCHSRSVTSETELKQKWNALSYAATFATRFATAFATAFCYKSVTQLNRLNSIYALFCLSDFLLLSNDIIRRWLLFSYRINLFICLLEVKSPAIFYFKHDLYVSGYIVSNHLSFNFVFFLNNFYRFKRERMDLPRNSSCRQVFLKNLINVNR